MIFKNLQTSGFTFEEGEAGLAFRFKILNTVMLIAAVFAFLFGLMHDLGINEIGPVHPKVDYLYSALTVTLIGLLRRSRGWFTPVTVAFLVFSYLTFVSALIFVVNDEFRVVWFYLLVFATYVLLGARAGMAMTLLSMLSIMLAAGLLDLQISQTAMVTSVLGLLIAGLLNRTYTGQVDRYETQLQKKNHELKGLIDDLDAALERSQEASRAKSLFLANISHEIRTPMNGVMGMLQVMEGTALDDEQKHYLETITRSGKTLQLLIDELLDLSRIEAGRLELNPEPFETFRWILDIQNLADPMFEDGVPPFVTEVSDELPGCLVGDAARLQQIVVNLLSNAAKFTRDGEVKLTIGGSMTADERYHLQLDVVDTGVGIPADKLSSIFDAFNQITPERISNKGVGLGLAISKRLADVMGGELVASSVVGEGSRFSFSIELPVAETPEEPRGGEESRSLEHPLSVLLVDDDAVNRLAVNLLLEQRGHAVTEVANGRAALEKLQDQSFDVILMDVHMPVMDGLAATREIRASQCESVAQMPIIGLTASVMNDEKKQYLDEGMNAVVEKPVVIDGLMKTVEQCLRRASGGGSGTR